MSVPENADNREWQKVLAWHVAGNPWPDDPPDIVDLAAYARDVSWRTRCAGTVILGFAVKIDDGSIGLINGMANLAQRDPSRVFNFDSPGGTVQLDAAQAIAFAEAVGEWVQLTFDRRALVLAAIAAGTITTTEQIDEAFVDVTTAWP